MAGLGDSRIRERFINLAGSFYLRKKSRNRKKKGCAEETDIFVLNYHGVSGTSFRKHLDYIRSHYQVLSPETFLNWLDDRKVIDQPSVLFSFDDAYLKFYEEIYPILRENKLPVFLFIPTGFIGRTDYFWEDELQVALQKTNACAVTVDDKRFSLHSKLYRTDFYQKILRYLRFLDQDTRYEIKKDLLMQLNVTVTEGDMRDYRFLGWPQILEMEKTDLVVLGSHTVNHPNLTLVSHDAVRIELLESKRTIENYAQKPVEAFAYPYGGPDSFDERTINELQKVGYICAFTTIQGSIKKRKNRFRLQRVMLFDYQAKGALALKLDMCSGDRSSTTRYLRAIV
jgi:peptidoglycan/xylan/chitin deacetylase (PgdA/CDA1 family)